MGPGTDETVVMSNGPEKQKFNELPQLPNAPVRKPLAVVLTRYNREGTADVIIRIIEIGSAVHIEHPAFRSREELHTV